MVGLWTCLIRAQDGRNLIFGALIVASLLSFPAQAATSADSFELRSAADLVDLCAVTDNDPMVETARGFCYGFLSGAGNYHRAINPPGQGHPLFCLPEKHLSRVATARMFVEWSRAHPQYLEETPIDNLMRFAVATWPCAQARQ